MDLGNNSQVRGLFLAALLAGVIPGQSTALGQDRFIRQPTKNAKVVPKLPSVSIIERGSVESLSTDAARQEPQVAAATSKTQVQETVRSQIVQPSVPNQVPASQFMWKPRSTSAESHAAPTSPFSFVSERKATDFAVVRDLATIERPAQAKSPDSNVAAIQPTPATKALPQVRGESSVNYREIATGISQELVAQFDAQRPTGAQLLSNLEAPPGWQAVGEQLSSHISRCDQLIARKAYLSATEEAQKAIHHLLRVLDLHGNQYLCEPLWAEAQQALREAEDFAEAQRLATDKQLLGRLIASHETQILKSADISQLSPLAAVQHYHRYAQDRLVTASQGHPWASELYYTLGRSFQALAETGDTRSEAFRWRALTYYRSARDILPTNAVATNQLGYILLKMDRAAEAREALIESVQSGGPIAAWENLVEASRRLGEASVQDWATRNYVALRQQLGNQPSSGVQLVEIDPYEFAALSPIFSGPQPVSHTANSMHSSSNNVPQSPNSYVASPMWNSPKIR